MPQIDIASLILLYTNSERINFTLLKIGNRDLIQKLFSCYAQDKWAYSYISNSVDMYTGILQPSKFQKLLYFKK